MKRWWWLGILCLAAGLAVSAESPKPVRLTPGGWHPFNRAELEKVLQTRGRAHRAYDRARPPYAVFDWDNTSVFLDVEEATITYQLDNLRFRVTPEQLRNWVQLGVPLTPFAPEYANAAGGQVDIAAITEDIVGSYQWLYEHYSGLHGSQTLEQVRRSPHFANFRTKLRYLYDALDGTFGARVSYLWITYFFTGLDEPEVRALVRDAVAWQLTQPIEKVTWSSPAELPGRAGVVQITWKNGLRLLPEMQELYRTLREQGFHTWVCTASLSAVIREVASNPQFGYNHPAESVIGMELEQDADGRFLPQARAGYELTFGPGKTQAVQRRLVSRYGYGPVLVAGDSHGDEDMLQDFPDTLVSLIIKRSARPDSKLARLHRLAAEQRGQTGARYLLQERDESLGLFRP
jgi:phosphoserine phosphatase